MAFDRTGELDYEYIASLIKEDSFDIKTRALVNYILHLFDVTVATAQSTTVATWATDLENAALA